MKKISCILYLLCSAFALTGMAFLLVPGQVIGLLNYGGKLGGVAPLPVCDCRFWNVFAFAYMVLVTLMAYLAARDPGNSRTVLWLLFAGKLSTSSVAGAMWFVDRPAMAYLATFAVDGGIAAIVAWCLWAVARKN